MEKAQFLTTLRDELITRGISREMAERHVRSLSLTLTPEDINAISRIEDPAEIGILAQGIADVKARTAENADAPSENADTDDDMKVYEGANSLSPVPHEENTDESIYESAISEAEAENEADVIPPSPRGQAIFWGVLIGTLPLSLAFLAIYFAAFGAVFAALCSIIIALFAFLIGGVAIGATVSLVGVIYGIIQLITETSLAPGLYEIGLGLSVAGIVMLAGILVYNIAIRLLPWVIRLLGKLFRICMIKLKNLFKLAKEVCYRL